MRQCRFCGDSGLVELEPVNPGADWKPVIEACDCAVGRALMQSAPRPTSAELMNDYDDLHGPMKNPFLEEIEHARD